MEKPPWSEHAFKSPKMNFKVNLFNHLYETPFTPLDIPNLKVQSGGLGLGRGGIMRDKQVCFKMLYRQNKAF